MLMCLHQAASPTTNTMVSAGIDGASSPRSIPQTAQQCVEETPSALVLATTNANHSTSSSASVAVKHSVVPPSKPEMQSEAANLAPPKKKRKNYGANSSSSSASPATSINGKSNSKSSLAKGISTGRWTDSEHQAFLRGLHLYGREWKKVASMISTRTSSQVRSHAQKYFTKMQRDQDAFMMFSNAAATGSSSVCSPRTTKLSSATAVHSSTESSAAINDDAGKSMSSLSPSLQATVAQILANPEAVEADIEDTLQRLRKRFTELQKRLKQIDQQEAAIAAAKVPSLSLGMADTAKLSASEPESSTSKPTSLLASNEPLHQEELIAVAVLQGALPRSGSPLQVEATPQKVSSQDSSLLDSVLARSPRKTHGFDLSPRPLKRKATMLLQAAGSSTSPPYTSASTPKQPTQ
mmetsp:Transcript_27552/g.75862  ORF Transcript_27552/g.75862 Transcript_27552/m.75862 type:complete len:409 (-) Transcript_27552:816-2042(-)